MQVEIAKNSGLCYGVRRALNLAQETRQNTPGRVYTLGDLIHNPQVILDLQKQGILSTENLDALEEGTVIIRSHGVSPAIYNLLEKKNLEIVDATCPIVKKIQERVQRLADTENEIVIFGNREHPETKGLIGFSKKKGVIIENVNQVKNLPARKKRAILAQSTQDPFLFKKVVAALIEKTKELKVYNTICQSTLTRQKSTSELASRVDILFIIGVKNSSNTRKLFEISKRILPRTYFIENSNQILPEMLKNAKRFGLSGGASTPPEAIQQAVKRIKSLIKHQFQKEKVVQCQS
jgi:4-hydroxy-3-methylbut-2-enyl diphosphate reductase